MYVYCIFFVDLYFEHSAGKSKNKGGLWSSNTDLFIHPIYFTRLISTVAMQSTAVYSEFN